MNTFESAFPKDFRKEDIARILKFVVAGKFCQLVCLPGAGKATMLKLLVGNQNLVKFHLGEKSQTTRFFYINLQELTDFQETQVLKFILFALNDQIKAEDDNLRIKKQIKETVIAICQKNLLVLLYDHFDEIQNHLGRWFFQLLKDLRNLAKYKFVAVLGTRRNLGELVDERIAKDFWDFFVGNKVYLKVYESGATEFLFTQIENVFDQKLTTSQKEAILGLTGGHAKLTKIITELLFHQNVDLEKDVLLKTNQVRAALFEIWLFLTAQEQATLYQISQKSQVADKVCEKLVKLDLIKGTDQPQQFNNLTIQQYSFTIPLFGEFVKTMPEGSTEPKIILNPETKEITKGENVISELLSSQEYRLLKFLIENRGRVVEREDLIKAVWPQTQVIEAISDEAIDQMIFRLRKKIEKQPAKPRHLVTVKGRGFRFIT